MTFDVEENNREIKIIGEELAVLCRAANLSYDLPAKSLYWRIWEQIDEAIDEILDRNMAVDPIEHAMGELSDGGHVQGLESLASALLRRRDDYGRWAARK